MEQVLPSVNGGELVGVTGFSAGTVDFNEQMSSRIWYVIGFVFAVASCCCWSRSDRS